MADLRSRAIKRFFDFVAALVALVAVAPLLGIAALLIKFEDRGPILFRQRRLGRSNRLFMIYKLRTMRAEASDPHGNRSTDRFDDRVTGIGQILRRTSIDELPQLINVLKGEMSIVGPRPHALGSLVGDKLFWEVDERYWRRHALRPGITGLAQVRGFRGATQKEADLTSRLEADLEYISSWNILLDLKIILLTFRTTAAECAY